ncbi:MAG: methyltransferase [bacterium]
MKLLRNVGEFYGTVGIPLVYLGGLWLIVYGERMQIPLEYRIGGLIGAVTGIGLWILSYLHLGSSFGVLPRTQKRVTRGVYGYLKHPMYKAIMLTFLGLSFANGSVAGAWYCVLVLCPLLYVRARLEERRLE